MSKGHDDYPEYAGAPLKPAHAIASELATLAAVSREAYAQGRADADADAKRYQWLRAQVGDDGHADIFILTLGSHDWGATNSIRSAAELDAAIDAEIKREATC